MKMPRLSGLSSGARGLASKARSTGGLVRDGMESYAASRNGGIIGKSIGAMAKHPGISAGVAGGAAVGYGAYRHRRGSQNRALRSMGPLDQ